MEGGFNSVPLGQAGTGSAFILPQSQTVSDFDNLIQDQVKARALAQRQQQLQAQQMAAAWKANQLKIKGGTIFQPEINARAAKVMQMGLDLQKAGVNPNTVSSNPNTQKLLDAYQNERASLLSDVDVRDAIVKEADASQKAISQQAPGYYDPQTIADQHSFLGKSLSDITKNGYQFPQLQKSYDLNADVNKLTPIHKEATVTVNGVKHHTVLPDEDAHQAQAQDLFINNPQARNYAEKKIGIPIDQLPATSDVKKITQQLDDFWRSGPNVAALAAKGITSYSDPKYKEMVDQQATSLSSARKKYDGMVDDVKDHLDSKVSTADDKSLDFAYQNEVRARARFGQDTIKFNAWKKNQQEEEGTFTLGNQDSYVPVLKSNFSNETGLPGPASAEPEKGASLYGVNLPAVDAVVRPSVVTDMKTGRTIKNTSPLAVKVSQIQMVPVFKGLANNDPRNGSEISARQLKEIIDGKSKVATIKNLTYQPFAYGIKSEKDAGGVHTVNTPIKFSYDALKGSNVKKINTHIFDEATQSLKALQSNEKFRSLSPDLQLEFIAKKYNLNLE